MEVREPRRKDRKLLEEEAVGVLQRCDFGVLATVDTEGGAYGVPLSYMWLNGAVYFHAALKGHKVENIKLDNRVSFTVVGERQPVYDNGFSTYYESAIVKGVVEEVTDPDEKYAILYALAEKYLPDHLDKADMNITKQLKATLVCVVRPLSVTGKSKRKAPQEK